MNIAESEHIVSWGFWFITFLILHFTFGGVALLTFWIPLSTVKGSQKHIVGGVTVLISVLVAVVCSFILIFMQRFDPVDVSPSLSQTLFYLYLGLFSLITGWHGIRVYLMQKNAAPYFIAIEKIAALFSLFFGMITFLAGFLENNYLYAFLPIVGIGLAIYQYRFWHFWPYEDFNILINEHMRSMITTIITTWTAFSVIVLSKFFRINQEAPILWLTPSLVFIPLIFYWKYRIKNNLIRNQ